jgi:hypothetical protein
MFSMQPWMVFLLIVGLAAIMLAHAGFSEGFQAGMAAKMCGIDMPNCPEGQVCINGVCARPDKPALPRNELPVLPMEGQTGAPI